MINKHIKINHLHATRLNPLRSHPVIDCVGKDDDDPLLVCRIKILLIPRLAHRYLLVLVLAVLDEELCGIMAELGQGREIEVVIDDELLAAVTFHWILGELRTEGNPRLDSCFAPIGLPFVRTSIQDIDELPLILGRFKNGGLAVWESNREGGRGVKSSGVGLPSFPVSLSPLITFECFRHEY